MMKPYFYMILGFANTQLSEAAPSYTYGLNI